MPDQSESLFHRYEIVVIATREPETKHLNGRLAIVDEPPSTDSEVRSYTVIVPPNDEDERWREGEWLQFQEHELFEWGEYSYHYQSDMAWSQSLKLGQEIGAIGEDERPAARGLPNAEQIIRLIEQETDDWRPIWHWLLEHAYVNELIKALKQAEEGPTRATICYLLAWKRKKRAVPVLVSLLNDPDLAVRGEAADALWRIGSDRAGPALLDQLLVETEDSNKTTLALALSASGYRPAIPRLIELLQANMNLIRTCAARALGELRAVEAESALINALSSETDEYAIQQMDLALERIRVQSVDPPG